MTEDAPDTPEQPDESAPETAAEDISAGGETAADEAQAAADETQTATDSETVTDQAATDEPAAAETTEKTLQAEKHPEGTPAHAIDDAHAAHDAHHHEHAAHGAIHVEVHPHVRWHADVLVDGHDIYHGFVKDVTDEGADLFLDHNLQYTRSVKLHIMVPPLAASSHLHVLAVSAKVLSTVFDSDEECFRSALLFTQFEPQSERSFLHNRLG